MTTKLATMMVMIGAIGTMPACAANLEDASPDISGAGGALECGAPFTFDFQSSGELVQRSACVRRTQTIVGQNGVVTTVVSTPTCRDLSSEDSLETCGVANPSTCWLVRLVSSHHDVYVGAGCGPVEFGSTVTNGGGSEPPPPSDYFGNPGYSRTDGCGIDEYGRWTCRANAR